jgi:proteasome accessory factor A
MPPEIETHLFNTVLTNGARYYVDHAHPEYSTPECADALELVCADKAGERILARSMLAARRLTEPGQEIVVYKNNSDGKGNSYGTHENYLVDRAVPFAALVRNLLPWFVSRQVFTEQARSGREQRRAVDYQISQRADFFEEESGSRPPETPDRQHARRAARRSRSSTAACTSSPATTSNLCEVATFLKVGSTAIVLR